MQLQLNYSDTPVIPHLSFLFLKPTLPLPPLCIKRQSSVALRQNAPIGESPCKLRRRNAELRRQCAQLSPHELSMAVAEQKRDACAVTVTPATFSLLKNRIRGSLKSKVGEGFRGGRSLRNRSTLAGRALASQGIRARRLRDKAKSPPSPPTC